MAKEVHVFYFSTGKWTDWVGLKQSDQEIGRERTRLENIHDTSVDPELYVQQIVQS